MKERFAVLSDSHLGVHKNSSIWLDASLKLYQRIADECVKRDIDTILHLGDFFHDRRSLNVKTLNYAIKIAEILNKFNTKIIIGNHDCYFVNNLLPTSLEIFEKYDNISIIKKPTQISDNVALCPWISSLNNQEEFDEKFKDIDASVIMGHFAFNGFKMNDYSLCYNGINAGLFKDFDLILSGHFHTPNKKDNIFYVGSAMPLTFHDVNSPRGFYIFENEEFEFIEFEEAPKYVLIYSHEEQFIPEKIHGNVVKLIYTSELSTSESERILNEIYLHSPLFVHTDFRLDNKGSIDRQDQEFEIQDGKLILYDYLSKIQAPKHINKNTVRQFIEFLLNWNPTIP